MLSGPAVENANRKLPSRPLRNTFFRAMPLRFHSDPLGKTRRISSQRFNIAGGARVLYLGEDHLTCLQETQALGWPATAVAIVPVQFQLRAVADLCDPVIQKLLSTNPAELRSNFRALTPGPAPTQLLGERCAAFCRIDGFIYESAALVDLAVFEAALPVLGSSLTVFDPLNNLNDQLP